MGLLPKRSNAGFSPLQRTPNPSPATSAFLVVQGLVVVLTADYLIAAAQSRQSTFSTAMHGLGVISTPPPFKVLHQGTQKSQESLQNRKPD